MDLIQHFSDYLLLEKNYSEHTITAYQKDLSVFSVYCEDHFNIKELDQVNYQIVRAWIVTLSDEGLSNRTINRKISSLKSFYKFLLHVEVIVKNPMRNHKALKTEKKVLLPFSEKEITEAVQEVDDLTNGKTDFERSRDKLIVELFYTSGIRRAELIGLQTLDVDLSSRTIKVLGKRNKERLIPIPEATSQLFQDYIIQRSEIDTTDSHFFITAKGNKLYPTLVYRIINSYFSKVSTKVKKSPHVLRHSYATELVNHGADLNSVKELLGHSNLAATQVYTHNSLEKLKQVYNQAHPRSHKNNKKI